MAGLQVESPSEGSSRSSFVEGHGIDIITINVGQGINRRTFSVHKTLICNSSEFFRAAFYSSFQEATKSTLDLPEEQAEVFAAFYEWLYTGTVKAAPGKFHEDPAHPILFSRLFSFAGRLMLFDVRNYAFEEIRRRLHNSAVLLPEEFITEVFQESAMDQVMRRYTARHCAWHIHQKSTTDWVQWANRLMLDVEFMTEVAMQLVKLSSIKYCPKLADPRCFTIAQLESGQDKNEGCEPISFTVESDPKHAGRKHFVTACPKDTAASVREKLQSVLGYAKIYRIRIFGGSWFNDDETLEHHSLSEGARLIVSVDS